MADRKRNVAVRITPDAVRQVRGGSPWVFDRSIDSVNFDAEPGTIAVLFDRDRKFVGLGLYDPLSPIRVKVLTVGKHTDIDDSFLGRQIAGAIGRRRELWDDAATDAFRLVHGENDQLPGLVIDRYATSAVIKLYSAAWLPHLDSIVGALADDADVTASGGLDRVVLRRSRSLDGNQDWPPTDVVYGAAIDGPVMFVENGLRFEADIVDGHKTGHFLDQRENRSRLGSVSAGSDVLDVFSATGGFSVNAAAGDATSVTMVDVSRPALATARRNLGHNGFVSGPPVISDIAADAFEALERLGADRAQFDVVIVDPPAFAQRQSAVPQALSSYERLTQAAIGVLRPGGVLVQSSCSARVPADDFFAAVQRGARRSGRAIHEIERTFQPVDHPVGFEFGAYLKSVFAHID